jgi:hypothetical protein
LISFMAWSRGGGLRVVRYLVLMIHRLTSIVPQ